MTNKATYKIVESRASQLALQKASELGLTITSGWRSKEHNAREGGAPNSFHLYGQAYDLTGDQTKMREFATWAKKTGFFAEVLYESKGHYDHVHVAWRPGAGGDPHQHDTTNEKALKIGLAVLALVALINDR
jgi:hypothetical protein